MKRKIIRGKLKWVKGGEEDNKKIKNATKITCDEIQFRSKLEAYCYTKFKEAGIILNYEKEKFTLIEGFEYEGKKIRPMTYTPDFTNDTFIIECKGFGNDLWPTKQKLFMQCLVKMADKRKFIVLKTQKDVNECITKILNYYENSKIQSDSNNSNNNSDFQFIYWS